MLLTTLARRVLTVSRCRNISFVPDLSNFGSSVSDVSESVPLFNAGTNVFNKMKTHCDKEYGGGSSSILETIAETGTESDRYLRWSGVMDFDESHAVKTKARGGFVAIKLDCKGSIDLLDYEGLMIVMRVKEDLKFILNMKCESFILNELFQVHVPLKGGPQWQRFFVPFGAFTSTLNGIEKEQPQDNDNLQFKSLGMLMTSEFLPQGECSAVYLPYVLQYFIVISELCL